MNGYLRRKCVNYANYSPIHGESSTIIELANTETGRSWQNKLLRCLSVCWAQRIQVLLSLWAISPGTATRMASMNGQCSWENRQLRCKSECWAQSIQVLLSVCAISSSLYNFYCQYKRAAQLLKLTVEVQKRVLGPESPDTLLSMHNLARSYYLHGKYRRAMQLGEQTVELRKRVLVAEHPSTPRSMHNLACCYHSQGQYEWEVPLLKPID